MRVTFEAPTTADGSPRTAHVGLGNVGERDRSVEVWRKVADGETVQMTALVDGPVRVRVGATGFVLPDGILILPVGQDQVHLRLVEACSLNVSVIDASNGLPIRGACEIAVQEVANGEQRVTASSVDLLQWELRTPRLVPGTYRVTVAVPGYAAWSTNNVVLAGPGTRAEVTARLEPAADWGRLELSIQPPPGGTLTGAHFHLEVRALETEPPAPYQALPPRTFDHEFHVATLPLPPGEYRVLVWAGRDFVGRLDAVAVEAGLACRASVQVRRGVLAPLMEVPWQPTFYSDSRVVAVATQDGEALPALWFESRTPTYPGQPQLMSRYDFRDEVPRSRNMPGASWDRASVDRRAVLGPYPYEAIIVQEGEGERARSQLFRAP